MEGGVKGWRPKTGELDQAYIAVPVHKSAMWVMEEALAIALRMAEEKYAGPIYVARVVKIVRSQPAVEDVLAAVLPPCDVE